MRRQAEADRIRWVLWQPVALGTGVGAYFALPVEPGWIWVIGAATLMLVGGAANGFNGLLAVTIDEIDGRSFVVDGDGRRS